MLTYTSQSADDLLAFIQANTDSIVLANLTLDNETLEQLQAQSGRSIVLQDFGTNTVSFLPGNTIVSARSPVWKHVVLSIINEQDSEVVEELDPEKSEGDPDELTG